MTLRDVLALLALLVLCAASGEREAELRSRLRFERAFAESVAYEADLWAESLADQYPNPAEKQGTP